MNKQELISAIASSTKLSKSDTEKVVNAFCDNVKKTLKKGQDVTITGFGRYYVSKHKARQGRNPQTGAPLTIPARKVPSFKSGKELKTAVQQAPVK